MRSPVYLDLDLLQNAADYYGVDHPEELQVRERGTKSRKAQAGLNVPVLPVTAGGETGSSDEVETSYTSKVRPVRVMNDVLDRLNEDGDLRRDVSNVGKDDFLELEGELVESRASQVGTALGAILPSMLPTLVRDATAGGSSSDKTMAQIAAQMFGAGATEAGPLLYELRRDTRDEPRVLAQLKPEHFFRGAGPDDLLAERTVLGTVERLIPEGTELSLDRWVLPGMPPAMRGMAGAEAFANLVRTFPGMQAEQDDNLTAIPGPAVLLRVFAVY